MAQFILYKSELIEEKHLLNLGEKVHTATDSGISGILYSQQQFNEHKSTDQLDYP